MEIAVLGAGSWGTALALLGARAGHRVRLWGRDSDLVADLRDQGENARYLPGFPIPHDIAPTADIEEAVSNTDLVLLVVPSHGMEATISKVVSCLPTGIPIVSCAKGIENETLRTMDEVLQAQLPTPDNFCFLSGPSFAKEVAAQLPTAVVVASRDETMATVVQEALSTDDFRIYTSCDVIGVEIGGAVKNVIAIAAGAADGLGLGHNTRAALITRGIAEMSRLAVARGADPLTLAGLAGMGDLVLTCTGDLSRNRHVGMELGRGQSLEQVLGAMRQVAEGVRTTRSIHGLRDSIGVEMPICETVYALLYEGLTPRAAVGALMGRKLRPEQDP